MERAWQEWFSPLLPTAWRGAACVAILAACYFTIEASGKGIVLAGPVPSTELVTKTKPATITLGQTLEAAIEPTDKGPYGKPSECFIFESTTSARIRVEMHSTEFNPTLEFGPYPVGGCLDTDLLEHRSYGTTDSPANLVVGVEEGTRYLVRAAPTFDDNGAFSLRVADVSAAFTSVAPASTTQSLAIGPMLIGSIETTDPLGSDGSYFDCYAVQLAASSVVEITAISEQGLFVSFGIDTGTGCAGSFVAKAFGDSPVLGATEDAGSYLIMISALSEGIQGVGEYSLGVTVERSKPGSIDELSAGKRMLGIVRPADAADQNGASANCYRLSGTAGEQVLLNVYSNEFYPIAELAPDDGLSCDAISPIQSTGHTTQYDDVLLVATLPETRRYIVRISAKHRGVGAYALTALGTGSAAGLRPIEVGQTLQGAIDASDLPGGYGKMECYVLAGAVANQWLEIKTTALVAVEFGRLAPDADCTTAVLKEGRSFDERELVTQVPSAGDYLIRVSSVSDTIYHIALAAIDSGIPTELPIAQLNADQAVDAALEPGGAEAHCYRFVAQGPGQVRVEAGSDDLQVSLEFGPDVEKGCFEAVLSHASKEENPWEAGTMLEAEIPAGAYLIRISSIDTTMYNRIGNYSLGLEFVQLGAASTLAPIAPGETITGQLDSTDHRSSESRFEDCFVIAGSVGAWLRIDATSANLDLALAFGPGGDASSCYRADELTNENGGDGPDPRLLATLDAAHNYVVRVSGGIGETGSYELSLNDAKISPIPPPSDIGPIRNIAGTLRIGDTVEGTLKDGGIRSPFDSLTVCYALVGPPGAEVQIDLTAASSIPGVELDAEIEFGLDMGGLCEEALLAAADSEGGPGTDARLFATLNEDGRALLRVANAHYTMIEEGEFLLTVSDPKGGVPVVAGEDEYDFTGVPPVVRPMTMAELWRYDDLETASFDAALAREWGRLEALLREVVDLAAATYGPRHPLTLDAQGDLADALRLSGRLDEAKSLSEQTLADFKDVLDDDQPTVRMSAYILAATLAGLGQYADQQTRLRDLISQLERSAPTDPLLPNLSSDLAESLRMQGKYGEAQPYLEALLADAEAASGPDSIQTVFGLANLARNLAAQGRSEEARGLLDRAIRNSAGLADDANQLPNLSDPDRMADFSDLGELFHDSQLYAEALPFLEAAVQANANLLGAQHPETLRLTGILASDLDALHRYEDAAQHHEAAVKGSRKTLGLQHPSTANATYQLALNFINRGEPGAGELLPVAIAAQEALFGLAHPDTLRSLETLSRLYLRSDQATDALSVGRRALQGRSDLMLREASSAPEQQRKPYESATAIAASLVVNASFLLTAKPTVNQGDLLDVAFQAAQQIRSADAAAAFARSAAVLAAAEAGLEADARAWGEVLAERNALDVQYAGSFNAGTQGSEALRANLVARRVILDGQIEEISERLRAEAPRFFELISPRPVTVAALQARGTPGALIDNEVLILLTQGDEHGPGFVFVVTNREAAWSRIDMGVDDLRLAISDLREQLDPHTAQSRAGTSMDDGGVGVFDRTAAFSLFQALFGAPQVAELLAANDKWILVPQGDLISLPFAVLVDAPPSGNDLNATALRETSWLGLNKQLLLSPSVAALHTQRASSRAPVVFHRPLFAMANPAFKGAAADFRVPAATDVVFSDSFGNIDTIRSLNSLPGTQVELLAVAEALGANEDDYFLDSEANETRLIEADAEGRLARARVVLLGTHGLLGVEAGFSWLAEPALVLSPPLGTEPVPIPGMPGDPPRMDDGLLTATEAAALNLSADWVILSACNTAAAGAPDAEGLSGLARGFLYAGAQALLVSHWPVSDTVGARLVAGAVQGSIPGSGVDRSAALQQAMAEIMSDSSRDASGQSLAHPAFWGPFVVVGAE